MTHDLLWPGLSCLHFFLYSILKMKTTQHIVMVLSLCTFLLSILEENNCDSYFEYISIVDTHHGTGFSTKNPDQLIRLESDVPGRVHVIDGLHIFTNKPMNMNYNYKPGLYEI